MKRYVGLLSYLFITILIGVKTQQIRADVVINEIYPKTNTPAEQWIELFNSGNAPISLDRWKIEPSTTTMSFTLNASSMIPAGGYLALTQSQTAIILGVSGDTITLKNERNETVDSQSYPGILGFNTAIGRSKQGAWAICSTATFNGENDCPEPTPTPTLAPTARPTIGPSVTPMPTQTPRPTAAPITPTPYPSETTFATVSAVQKSTISYREIILAIGVAWGIIALIFIGIRFKKSFKTK